MWIVGLDATGTLPRDDIDILTDTLPDHAKLYVVVNKADLRPASQLHDIIEEVQNNLEEYDIDCEGISAYSSEESKEYDFHAKSIHDVLSEWNTPASSYRDIIKEINHVFQQYFDAFEEDITDKKEKLSRLNKLDLDLYELGAYDEKQATDFTSNMFFLMKKDDHKKKVNSIKDFLSDLRTFHRSDERIQQLEELRRIHTAMLDLLGAEKDTTFCIPSGNAEYLNDSVQYERPPLIHGWNSYEVRALQKGTADAFGLSVMFRDRLNDGSAGPEMVVIPAGRFLMGSPEDEEARYDDERQHEVTIERPFALGRYPVTFDEYDRFCDATGRDKPEDEEGWGRGRRPVINVSWYDAMAYCQWLSEQTGQTYRLPSEAEWEYACRAGTTTPFHFGETISTEQANYDGYVTYGKGVEGDYWGETTPVGQFPANAWGLHDMHGNVWEWTGSEYDHGYTGREQGLLAADAADAAWPVFRGGSWLNIPHRVRSADRDGNHPDSRNGLQGLRLARSP